MESCGGRGWSLGDGGDRLGDSGDRLGDWILGLGDRVLGLGGIALETGPAPWALWTIADPGARSSFAIRGLKFEAGRLQTRVSSSRD